jgi:hypothetical protein
MKRLWPKLRSTHCLTLMVFKFTVQPTTSQTIWHVLYSEIPNIFLQLGIFIWNLSDKNNLSSASSETVNRSIITFFYFCCKSLIGMVNWLDYLKWSELSLKVIQSLDQSSCNNIGHVKTSRRCRLESLLIRI